jgi:hypothetical protein
VEEAVYLGDYTVTANGSAYTSQNGQVTLSGLTEGELSYTVSNPNPDGYPDVVTYKGEITVAPAGGGGDGGGVGNEFSVSIAVVGKAGELIYGPSSVFVSEAGEWGCTAMGALCATGLNYTMSSQFDGYVDAIDGLAKSGLNGWMFKVNNVTPMVLARDKTVKKGDKIIWWYSSDMDDPGPDWNSLTAPAGGAAGGAAAAVTATVENSPQISKEVQEALDKIAELLGLKQGSTDMGPVGEAATAVVVIGGNERLTGARLTELNKALSDNIVGLEEKVEAGKGASVSDKLGEVSLYIPAGALRSDITVSITEAAGLTGEGAGEGGSAPDSYRQLSHVYRFGPDGTTFAQPATLILKVPIPLLAKPANMVLAWYDKSNNRWVAIPAVVDVVNGLIIAEVSHFSDFAVLARQEKKSFDDVTIDSYGWSREAVELLSGAGIISGTGGRRYEPERAITRAELTSILVKAMNLPAATGGAAFTDVTGSEWYAACVAAASEAGLVAGYEDGTFRPDRTITREEMVAVLARALDLAVPADAALPFNDESGISPWAKNSVASVVSGGLIKGYPDGTFQPQGTANRAECAVMVYHALAAQ